jgi:hypothetical protein
LSILRGDAVSGNFDPNEFFQNRVGLWRSEAFVERILSVAKKTERILLPSHIPSLTLHKNMNDTEVCKELGDNYVFEATEGGVVIAEMINRQPNGEDGDLVNDGKANIFYVHGKDVEVFAVHVSWDAGVREWNVRAYRLDDDRWPAGHRAFSRNSTFGN